MLPFGKEDKMNFVNVIAAPEVTVGKIAGDDGFIPAVCLHYPFGLFIAIEEMFHFPDEKPVILPEDVILNVDTTAGQSGIKLCALCLNLKEPIIFEAESSDYTLDCLIEFRAGFERHGKFILAIVVPTPSELSRPLGRAMLGRAFKICQVDCRSLHHNHPNFGQVLNELLNRRHNQLLPKEAPILFSNN